MENEAYKEASEANSRLLDSNPIAIYHEALLYVTILIVLITCT